KDCHYCHGRQPKRRPRIKPPAAERDGSLERKPLYRRDPEEADGKPGDDPPGEPDRDPLLCHLRAWREWRRDQAEKATRSEEQQRRSGKQRQYGKADPAS